MALAPARVLAKRYTVVCAQNTRVSVQDRFVRKQSIHVHVDDGFAASQSAFVVLRGRFVTAQSTHVSMQWRFSSIQSIFLNDYPQYFLTPRSGNLFQPNAERSGALGWISYSARFRPEGAV